MHFRILQLVVSVFLLANAGSWPSSSWSSVSGNLSVQHVAQEEQLSDLFGSEVTGSPRSITVAYMTAFEWEALNIEADKATLVKLRAEGRFPPEIADQIPDPEGIVPVYPRGPNRRLMVVDLREGIQYKPTLASQTGARAFDNLQVVIDLALATPVQISAQSPDSTFWLEGALLTLSELEHLLQTLKPTETLESDWVEDLVVPTLEMSADQVPTSLMAPVTEQSGTCTIQAANTRGLLTYNGSDGYQAYVTVADPYITFLGSMSFTRVGNGDPYIVGPDDVAFVEIGWAKDLCWITPNPSPGACSYQFQSYGNWKLATRHLWVSDGIRGYRGGDIANAMPGQTHFYRVEYVAPGWKLYVNGNEIAYLWTGHWRSYPAWSGCGNEVTEDLSTHVAASSCLNNAFRLGTTWYYVGGWWCAEESHYWGRLEALPGYSWRSYDIRDTQ